jgi:hypothetical protein
VRKYRAARPSITGHPADRCRSIGGAPHERNTTLHQEGETQKEALMTSFNDRYPKSGYFTAADLLDQPDLDVQIECVDFDVEIGNKTRDIVQFTNDGRSLVLNRACGSVIAALHGDEIEGWCGKWITLFADTTVKFNNEIKPGIRVRPVEPKIDGGTLPATRTVAQNSNDEFGF